MIRRNSISAIGQILFGVLLALIVLTQSAYVVPQTTDSKEQQSNDPSSEADTPTIQSKALPNSSFQINLEVSCYSLEGREYGQEDDEVSNPLEWVVQSCQKAVKVLFRKIISPNAP